MTRRVRNPYDLSDGDRIGELRAALLPRSKLGANPYTGERPKSRKSQTPRRSWWWGLSAVLLIAGCEFRFQSYPTPQPTGRAMRLVTETPCPSLVLPLLHDTSDNPDGVPWNPRALGVLRWQRDGEPYLIANLGNDLAMWKINNPAAPGPKAESHFGVPPFGDRDYNLFSFDICDGCRLGIAGFDAQGMVIWDSGTLVGHPRLSVSKYHPSASGIGGVTYMAGGSEYLIARNLPGSTCSGKPTLWRIWGLGDADREVVQCLSAGTQAIGCDGGYRLSDATGDYVVVADQSRRGWLFRILADGQLAYTGVYYMAPTSTGHGLAYDPEHHLVASAFGHVRLYSTADEGLGNPVLVADWEPETAHVTSLVALKWPYLLVGPTAGQVYAYSVADPANPVRVDEVFWSASQPWNSYDYAQFRDAVFTDDGGWMFLARFSVLERFAVSGSCIVPPEPPAAIFSNGFESGDTSAWR